MGVAVVVPCRLDAEDRAAAWSFVQAWYAEHHPGWEVVTGTCSGPWVKALAVADGLRKTDADTLLIADADVVCDDLTKAVDALDRFPWAIPHHLVHRLTEASTAAVLAGGPLEGDTTQHPYKGYPGGGFMALHRDLYEEVPLDPRFVGWGQEDSAWHLALTRIAGRGWRGKADCWHLWHEPQPRMTRQVGSQESADLLHRYRQARDRDRMLELLAEATDAELQAGAQPQGHPRASAVA